METMNKSSNKPTIADDVNFTVWGWMKNHLELKKSERDVFAIIYGFSSKGSDGCYFGTQGYLQEFADISKETVNEALKEIVRKGYCTKHKKVINGKMRICYQPTDEVRKFDPQSQKIGLNEVRKSDLQGQKIGHNNKRDNKDNNKVINSAAGKKAKGLSIEPSYDIEEYERQANQPPVYVSQKEKAAQENEQPQQ